MKHLIKTTIPFLMLVAFSCSNNQQQNKLPTDVINIGATADSSINQTNENAPELTFAETEHNFGKITDGEQVTYAFKFTNTGKSDLLIASAAASCGCTVPQYPKTLIASNATESVTVKFDSKGKVGVFEKTITIVCNTNQREHTLTISGEVLPK